MTVNLQDFGLEDRVIAGHQMTVRDLGTSDMDAVLRLHQQVFSSAVNVDWYAWKYQAGLGEAVGVFHDGALIAHCAGLPRSFCRNGEKLACMQIGDVMVAPQWRGILTRRGPFFHVSQQLYQSRLGKEHRFALGYGFPSARHLTLANKTGLLWDAGTVHELKWRLSAQGPQPGSWLWRTDFMVPQDPSFDAIISNAWKKMQRSAGSRMLGERDVSYVRWRFEDRPDQNAVFWLFSRPWRAAPLGMAVMSPVTPGQAVHWLDWIGPIDQMGLASILCQAEAGRQGATEMLTWASKAVQDQLAASGITERNEVAKIGVPTASDVPSAGIHALEWWLMSGDTDFL
jgi:hypothetical protein